MLAVTGAEYTYGQLNDYLTRLNAVFNFSERAQIAFYAHLYKGNCGWRRIICETWDGKSSLYCYVNPLGEVVLPDAWNRGRPFPKGSGRFVWEEVD